MSKHGWIERSLILVCGVVVGLSAAAYGKSTQQHIHDESPASAASSERPRTPRQPRVPPSPGTAEVSPVAVPESQPAATGAPGAAPTPGAATDSEGLVAQAKADPWYERDPSPDELDDAARMKSLDRDHRLPLDPALYMNRSYRHKNAFVPLQSGMAGVRARPGPLTASRMAAPTATDETREKFRLELWQLEVKRREAEVMLVEHQNALARGPSPLLERLDDIEFWFTRDDKIFVLRSGQDPEHSRRLELLAAADHEISALKQRYRDQYGRK
jgi:hypothetical protein